MSWFDIIIIIILAGFAWYGFFSGLIRAVGGLLGLLIGAYIAVKFYIPLYNLLDKFIPGTPEAGKVVVFIICFSLVSRVVSWLIVLLEQGFNLISIIPFLKSANRLLGLVFGLLEGVLVLGIAAYILSRHLPEALPLAKWLDTSKLAPWLIYISKILAPLLPQVYNRLQSLI